MTGLTWIRFPVSSSWRHLIDELSDEWPIIVQVVTEFGRPTLPLQAAEALPSGPPLRSDGRPGLIAANPGRQIFEFLAARKDRGQADDAAAGGVRSAKQ